MKISPAESTATPVGIVKLGGGGLAAVAAVTRGSIAGDGGDHAGGAVHLANPVVARVGDEDVPGGVHRHAAGDVELGSGGRAAVAAVTSGSVAGHGGDHARGMVHLANRDCCPCRR